MREAMLVEKLEGGAVRCDVCQWRCTIRPGKLGVCRMRRNDDGELTLLNYAEVSSVNVDPIEKKPLFHFYPGSTVFSLGTWGCNFHCLHCQNWEISFGDPGQRGSQTLSPEDAIALTQRYGCEGIAWTYNEPGIWFEYTYDCARLAKERGLYTVYVTNGFMTEEALDVIGPYLDAFRVDVKGFSTQFYQRLAKVSFWHKILDVAERAKKKWGMHVEVVTNVIPTMNDDEEQLSGIARWIHDSLGELTPWHVTRFHPEHQLRYLPATPLATLERAYAIGRREGLRFVYIGNVPGHESETTVCYHCGQVAVRRWGYSTEVVNLEAGRCRSCGADLNFRTTSVQPPPEAGQPLADAPARRVTGAQGGKRQ